MISRRVTVLARRVIRQLVSDRRNIGLVIFAPMFVLTLGSILFRADQPPIPIGYVNEDDGATLPFIGELRIADKIVDELVADENFIVVELKENEIEAQIDDGSVQGALVFPDGFSASLIQDQSAELDLRLEGSNPSRSQQIASRVAMAATKAVVSVLTAGLPGGSAGSDPPLQMAITYLHGSESFDTMDYIAPVYIAFLGFFFVFLLTCVSFLRERSQGTMERLLATPTTRIEIILGYLAGLGTFAIGQVAVILFFTILVLKIHYLGSLWLLFLVIAVLALVGVIMGILASTFARTEFQVLQFIPIVIIPQVLLSGLIWPVEEMPGYLIPFAYAMPLTYANQALRDVMLKGLGFGDIWVNLAVLLAIFVVLIALGAVTMRRELA
jgi:ABC-2 type transport system permease protein